MGFYGTLMGFNGILMGYMMVIINTLRHRPYIDLIIYIYIYTIWLWHSQFAMVGIDGPNRNRWSSQRTKYQRSIYLWIFHGELWISHNQMVYIYIPWNPIFLWFSYGFSYGGPKKMVGTSNLIHGHGTFRRCFCSQPEVFPSRPMEKNPSSDGEQNHGKIHQKMDDLVI